MKNALLSVLLLCAGLAHGQGFDGTTSFSTKRADVDHVLSLSRWQVDAKGVPSFDYVYEQRARACRFRVAGHAEAMVEDVNGKSELVVFNPQDVKGRAMPQVVAYDSDDVTFSLPLKGKLNRIGLRSPLRGSLRERACDKGSDEGLAVTFSR